MAGSGVQPAGTSSAGIGSPQEGNPQDGVIFRSPQTGTSCGSRYIDQRKRDYQFDVDGRTIGMPNVAHLVQYAITTDRGSAAVQNLGQELRKLDRITPNFEKRVLTTLTSALQHLINAKLVEVVGFTAFRSSQTDKSLMPGRYYGRLLWRDLSTKGEPLELII